MVTFNLKIIRNVLVSSFRFIINICTSFSVGIELIRQILTSKVDPRAIQGKVYHTLIA